MSEAPKSGGTLTDAEIERWYAEVDAEFGQRRRDVGDQGQTHNELTETARQSAHELGNTVPDKWCDPEITGELPPATATPLELLAPLAAFPREISDALVKLSAWHSVLLASARTTDDIRFAFIPLLVARCFFGENGGLLPPSKIERALRAEAKTGWRGHEFPKRLTGRPLGPWTEFTRQRIEEFSRLMSHRPADQWRAKNWVLAKGKYGSGRWGRSASPGTEALLDYIEAGWKARGHADAEIQRGKREVIKALDNIRRGSRQMGRSDRI